METAEWKVYPPEHDDSRPLWALVRCDGVVLWETDSKPSKACNRELAREWEVVINQPETR